MKVQLRSTSEGFSDIELNVDAEEIQALKQVDAVEFGGDRYIPLELVFDAEGRRFILWVDKE